MYEDIKELYLTTKDGWLFKKGNDSSYANVTIDTKDWIPLKPVQLFAKMADANGRFEGIQAYTGVTIISSKSEVIKYQLVNKLGRGITVYKGERGFLPGNFEVSSECDIIFTVVTRLELRKLKNLVHEVDPKAFMFANTIRETTGGVLKRKSGH